jgi:hypothetical protein
MNKLAPILLFTYKRLDTLKTTVDALKGNFLADQCELYIFSDGAKKESDKIIIGDIRKFLKTVSGFKQVYIKESEFNKGLASSIIDGVNYVLQTHDTVIVLEDDLSTTPNFISFMNSGLTKYFPMENAFSISGYSFDLGQSSVDTDDAYFLNRGWSWGWATWKNRWENIDWDIKDYESFVIDPVAKKEFAKGGSDLNKMLKEQMTGKLDSWAIRWFYNQFKSKGLTLYPITSKVYNNGFDEDATHTSGSITRYLPNLDSVLSLSFKMPKQVKVNNYYQNKFNIKMGLRARVLSKLETIILKFFK